MVQNHAAEDAQKSGQAAAGSPQVPPPRQDQLEPYRKEPLPLPQNFKDAEDQAETVVIRTVTDMWKEAPKLLPLLAVVCYGLGRLIVDGFYSRLNTNAEAAGVGYFSIIEPAAVFAAIIAIIGTAIAIVFDVANVCFRLIRAKIADWIKANSVRPLTKIIGRVASLAFITIVIASFAKVSPWWHNTDVRLVIMPSTLVAVIVAVWTTHNTFGSDTTRWTRASFVGLSLISLAILCFGAHEWGVYEAGKVANRQEVSMNILGLDMSAVGAAPVRVQTINTNPAIEQLSLDGCLLEIGSGPYNFLFFDPVNRKTLSVPANEVVVTSSSAGCKK
jgi:hypothetical protein